MGHSSPNFDSFGHFVRKAHSFLPLLLSRMVLLLYLSSQAFDSGVIEGMSPDRGSANRFSVSNVTLCLLAHPLFVVISTAFSRFLRPFLLNFILAVGENASYHGKFRYLIK